MRRLVLIQGGAIQQCRIKGVSPRVKLYNSITYFSPIKSADNCGADTAIVSLTYGSFGVEQPIFYTLLIAVIYFKVSTLLSLILCWLSSKMESNLPIFCMLMEDKCISVSIILFIYCMELIHVEQWPIL